MLKHVYNQKMAAILKSMMAPYLIFFYMSLATSVPNFILLSQSERLFWMSAALRRACNLATTLQPLAGRDTWAGQGSDGGIQA